MRVGRTNAGCEYEGKDKEARDGLGGFRVSDFFGSRW